MRKSSKNPSKKQKTVARAIEKDKGVKKILMIGFIVLAIGFVFPSSIGAAAGIISSILVLGGLIISYIGFFKLDKSARYESQGYLRESRNTIFIMLGIFIISIIIAFAISGSLSKLFDPIISEIMRQAESTEGAEIISFIFLNNIDASFIGLFAGIIILIPIYVTVVNGAMIGYVLARIYEITGVTEFWRLFPHGIFELPAVLISLALGVRLGLFFAQPNPRRELKRRFYNSFIIFLKVIIPLLIIAAIIEGGLILVMG